MKRVDLDDLERRPASDALWGAIPITAADRNAMVAELRASRLVVELAFRAGSDGNDPEWIRELASALGPLA